MTNCLVGFVTCDSQAAARRITQAILKAKAAACVNILPRIESHYWWQGKIATDKEWLLVIKTTQQRIREVERIVKQIHNYEVPEMIFTPVTYGERRYLKWLRGAVAALALLAVTARADQIDDFIKQLGAAEEEQRAEAADSLARIGGPRVEQQFREMLKSDSPERRQLAVVGLLQVSDATEDLELVRARLKDENSTVRWSAVIALGHSGRVEALPWLEEVATSDASDSVKEAATEGVAKLRSVIPWKRSLPEALKDAKTLNKPVLAYFALRGSDFCQQLDEGVLADAAVVDAAQEFVPVRIDAGKAADEARKLDVRGVPTILVLDVQCNEMGRVSGLVEKDKLLAQLNEARRGKLTFREAKRQALRDPADVPANWKVAQSYLEDGREDLAEVHLRNVIAHDEVNRFGYTDNAMFMLGFVLGRRGEYAKAILCLNEVLTRWPEFKDRNKALYCLGLSQLAVGEKDAGRATLNKLLTEFPGSATAAGARKALDKLGGK